MPKITILPGQTYGRWTILKEVDPHIYPSGQKGRRVLCRCACGAERTVLVNHLRRKNTTSCGCYRDEQATKRIKHGHARRGNRSAELITYYSCKDRCLNPSNADYSLYGGRGIEFRFKSFQEFYDCLGPRPSKRHSIDRIDNNGHYARGNVRWTTMRQQANNTRRNRMVTYDNQTKSVSQWARELKMKEATLRHRIFKYGWSVEKAFNTPVGPDRRK